MSNSIGENYFAGFIMTYERAGIITDTIDKIFAQTFPPQKLLIVDNSLSYDTKDVIERLNNPKIEYYRVGKNIGPAGASKIGLEKLTEQGFKWIYWGDDDDPPFFSDTLQKLLITANRNEKVGMVGAVGHYFNRKKGAFIRVADDELSKEGDIEIDSIAGGMTMIINSEVVKKGAIPDDFLIFGLEELSVCLKIKNLGYKAFVPRSVYFDFRKKSNRFGFSVNPAKSFPKESALWRSYYSRRNLIYILYKNEKCYIGAIRVSLRGLVKAFVGFRHGIRYGILNTKMELKGVLHGWLRKMGMRVSPIKKY